MPLSSMHQALVDHLYQQGITHPWVLAAMREIDRRHFVPPAAMGQAYANVPLSIGEEQTISQPYMVALMTQALLQGKTRCQRILDVGTGSAYHACVLACLADTVYTIERIHVLFQQAQKRVHDLKKDNVICLYGNGMRGHAPGVPYSGIIVAAVAHRPPRALLAQLAPQGRLVMPLYHGEGEEKMQYLYCMEKQATGQNIVKTRLCAVRFVPFLPGKA